MKGFGSRFSHYLKTRLPVQIDIGFGDVVTPDPLQTLFPALLEFPEPILLAYPRETVIAEKFEALVKLGIADTRMKDSHDVRTLSRLFAFSGGAVSEAIRRTFERRQTTLLVETPPIALTAEFYDDEAKQRQWSAFVAKNKLYIETITLRDVVTDI